MWGQGKWKAIAYWWEKQRYYSHSEPILCVYIYPQVFCIYPRAHKYRPNTWDLMGFREY